MLGLSPRIEFLQVDLLTYFMEKRDRLQAERQQLLDVVELLKAEQSDIQRKMSVAMMRIAKIDDELSTGTTISDHCLVRYFERVLGYDLDEVRQTILDKHYSNLRIVDGVAATLVLSKK